MQLSAVILSKSTEISRYLSQFLALSSSKFWRIKTCRLEMWYHSYLLLSKTFVFGDVTRKGTIKQRHVIH